MKATLTRECSVCESPEKRILFRQPLVLPEGRSSYGGYDIVVCSNCGFIYADNTISQAALDTHYTGPTKAAQDLAEKGEPAGDSIRLANTAAVIKRFLRPSDRMLDIGCGAARLLNLLKQSGFDELRGLDPSPVAAQFARSKYGIEVEEGNIFDYKGRVFDLVSACHVLEHVVDLCGFLRRVYSLVRENGLVYLEVPDVSQFDRFTNPSSPDEWIYLRDLFTHFTPEHVNFFSPVSLRNLMTRFGFDEVLCESDPLGVLVSVWRRRAMQADTASESVLVRYAAESQAAQSSAIRVIERLARSGEEVLVWGAGLHTQRLLASGPLAKVRIRAFVDSDPAYSGAFMAGRPIITPDEIHSLPGCLPILISSWKAQAAIVRAMESMKLPNQPILLYI
jgi:SAM-dependent methyltransferase